LGITKYDAKQDLVQWLRWYTLSIKNTGGNNDTKCLYFPFFLDEAPLTWLQSLEKYSIDKCDQLMEQFTSNFAGTMVRSGTRMDLVVVKQEQGETLRQYMRRFFDKCTIVVDVLDKGHRPLPRRSLPPSHLRRLRSSPPELHHPPQGHDHLPG
jgi:hypothetical protein